MVQTLITPKKTNFDMSVLLPMDYVGKKVHVLFYIEDEVKTTTNIVLPTQKPSDFFGSLSIENGAKMHAHAIEIRKEWNRDI